MKLTKFEAVMTMGDKECKATYDGQTLTMDGVPPEYAQALVAHLERFKLRAPKKPWKKKTSSNGVTAHAPAKVVDLMAKQADEGLVAVEEPVPETPAAKAAVAKVAVAVAAKQAAAEEPPAGDEVAGAKQVSDLVHVLVAKRGFADVEALVQECQRLKDEGHPAVVRVANLDDRVRRRAVLEGLEV